jgi:hypothetical protein
MYDRFFFFIKKKTSKYLRMKMLIEFIIRTSIISALIVFSFTIIVFRVPRKRQSDIEMNRDPNAQYEIVTIE